MVFGGLGGLGGFWGVRRFGWLGNLGVFGGFGVFKWLGGFGSFLVNCFVFLGGLRYLFVQFGGGGFGCLFNERILDFSGCCLDWMDEGTDGWMSGCIDGWMDGWMDEWVY